MFTLYFTLFTNKSSPPRPPPLDPDLDFVLLHDPGTGVSVLFCLNFFFIFFFLVVVVVAGQCHYMQVIRLPYQYPNLTQNQRLTERERKRDVFDCKFLLSSTIQYSKAKCSKVKQSLVKYRTVLDSTG